MLADWAQLMIASFCAPVMTPCVFRSFVTWDTQLTKALWFAALAAHWAIRSEIEQPVGSTVFGTPELQLPTTTVGDRFEFGH